MSSGPRTEPTPGRTRREPDAAAQDRAAPGRLLHPSRWTLRTRLLTALIALLAVVCVVIGVVFTVSLNQTLQSRLDAQLQAAAGRSLAAFHDQRRPANPDEPPPEGENAPAPDVLNDKTLIALQSSGTLGVSVNKTPVTLHAAQSRELASVPVDNRPHTRDLGPLGDYRLIALTDRETDAVIITGLPLADNEQTVSRTIVVEMVVAGAALLVAGLVGAVIVRRALRPLNRVISTARRVSALPLESGEVALSVRVPDSDPHTEVGQVGAAINRMLGHVERALAARHASEQRVRQFVADASHELRTPLAAIRGYAELTRRVPDEVPPDVTHAIGRVESEAARMTTLVEDLLLLARLDSGRPLSREPVELARMIVDAVGDAHIADPAHSYHLDLPEDEVTVPGDEHRLHQVVANLLANARTHTPPGTTVTVSLATVGDEAVLTVRDNGPGIPPDLLPDIFQRFARADTSRSRAAGSTGLGLSIVDAVVSAHGGTVNVDSTPGDTAFTVRLPLS